MPAVQKTRACGRANTDWGWRRLRQTASQTAPRAYRLMPGPRAGQAASKGRAGRVGTEQSPLANTEIIHDFEAGFLFSRRSTKSGLLANAS